MLHIDKQKRRGVHTLTFLLGITAIVAVVVAAEEGLVFAVSFALTLVLGFPFFAASAAAAPLFLVRLAASSSSRESYGPSFLLWPPPLQGSLSIGNLNSSMV